MAAEQLIALEAAIADLGALYMAARAYAALHARAETDLLPRLHTLGGHLRSLLRASPQLSEEDVDRAAREIMALGSDWRSELERLHASTLYQAALRAWESDRQADLAQLLPELFTGVHLFEPAPTLFFSVSPSTGRRRPGGSPFLSVADCADRITDLLTTGIVAESGGTEWWERELAYISGGAAAEALDTPIALRLSASEVRHAVFTVVDEPTSRIYTPRLHVPMSIVLAVEATDEWWEAYEDSYQAFRDALHAELTARRFSVEIAAP